MNKFREQGKPSKRNKYEMPDEELRPLWLSCFLFVISMGETWSHYELKWLLIQYVGVVRVTGPRLQQIEKSKESARSIVDEKRGFYSPIAEP